MVVLPSTVDSADLNFFTYQRITISENSAHRLDRSSAYYNNFSRKFPLLLINATSNIRACATTEMNLYTEKFYKSFLGGE